MMRGAVLILACALVVVLGGCGSTQKLTGKQLAHDVVAALRSNQFYKSAARAQCEPVEVKAGSISDCAVWFRKPIFIGDATRKHAVRVTIDDAQGHFSYVVNG